jgi:hypothetical protein
MDTPADELTPSKRYYLKNRERILAREREKRRWVTYYEKNKETVNARHRAAYQRRKEVALAAAVAAAAPGPAETPGPATPV